MIPLLIPVLLLLPAYFQNASFRLVQHVQEFILEGKVLDADTNEPLLFANVKVKEKNLSTQTDLNGDFRLKADFPINTIIVTYVGYTAEEIDVSGKSNITVRLKPSSVLNEIVVVDSKVYREGKALGYAVSATAKTHGTGNQGFIGMQAEDNVDWNTEDYDIINENRFLDPLNNPLSTFSIDVDGASYSNLRRYLNFGQMPPKDAVRIEEMVNYFDYTYQEPEDDVPFSVYTETGPAPWNAKHKLVHIGLQGKKINTEDLPPSNLTFLIDVSGSMQAYNKLPLVKSSLRLLVEQLRPQDHVAIVVYASASGLVLEPTSGKHKEKILQAVDNLRAGGSTAGAEGIRLAYQSARNHFKNEGNNRVILLTDGDFNVGVSSDAELVRIIDKERESGVFLTVLGFGMGNYKDNKMQKLADAGNGHHGYVDNITEARKVFVNEFGGTLFTIAKDVKIQVEFNPKHVQAYRLIGYENRMLQAEDFNDDKKDAGEIGAGHTVTALYEIIPVGVKSKFIGEVDDLRFQENSGEKVSSHTDELLFVKIRYKEPDGQKSKLLEHPCENKTADLGNTTNAFRWSAAVASFGMLLRDSEFKGDADYALVETLSLEARGDDPYGYRHEFINMVQSMKALAKN